MNATDFCAECPAPAPLVRPASASVRRAPVPANARSANQRACWRPLTYRVSGKSPILRVTLPPDPGAKPSTPDTFQRKGRRLAPPAILPAPTTVARPREAMSSGKQVFRLLFRRERSSLRQSPQSSPPQLAIAAGDPPAPHTPPRPPP